MVLELVSMEHSLRHYCTRMLLLAWSLAVCGLLVAPHTTAAAPPGRRGPLTEREMRMARIAWKYFENNLQPATGLVNAVDNYPSTSLWDIASSLGGTVAAYELGIITPEAFDRRLNAMLTTLQKMSLFKDELPNKSYHTQTVAKVNYKNQPGEIGFSALDLGRLLIWLKIVKERYPAYAEATDRLVLRWNFCHVLDKFGSMYGALLDASSQVKYVQEGRLGYEEYAAKGFQLWGFKTDRASKPEPYSEIAILGVNIPYDSRDPRKLGAHNYVVSESYILDGIELYWDLASDRSTDEQVHSDTWIANAAQRIYQVQATRYRTTGMLTARTEHQLDGPPFFVYDTIYTDGYTWNTITEDGQYVPQFAAVAFKAVLGLWVLWQTDYTDILLNTIVDLYDPAKGFYEGLYENGSGPIKTFTANSNGVILEALLYKVQGKLLRFGAGSGESLWERAWQEPSIREAQCLPK